MAAGPSSFFCDLFAHDDPVVLVGHEERTARKSQDRDEDKRAYPVGFAYGRKDRRHTSGRLVNQEVCPKASQGILRFAPVLV